MTNDDYCPCGLKLHYKRLEDEVYMRELVKGHPTVKVTTVDGVWLVSRHYIALHQVEGPELPTLAEKYGWERVYTHQY